MKWSADTLNSNKKDSDKYRLLKMLPKLHATKSLHVLRLRKFSAVLRKNSRKTSETNFISKKVRRLLSRKSEQNWRKENV